MKKKLISPLVLIVFGIVILITCKKKDIALSPVANAGSDTTINLVACGSKGSATLDGSHSSDPDNNLTGYQWSQISGPSTATFTNPAAAKTTANNLSTGQHVFQLKVSNAKGLLSRDTVIVIVATSGSDLDLTINGSFNFQKNYEDCYYGPPCWYYDNTTILIKFNFPQFGPFNFWTYETADTASTNDAHNTSMALYSDGNSSQVGGPSSINFKKIIKKGGGAFSGTLKIDYGSAEKCNPNIFTTLDPLTITGSLDTTAHTVSLNIKGKTYF